MALGVGDALEGAVGVGSAGGGPPHPESTMATAATTATTVLRMMPPGALESHPRVTGHPVPPWRMSIIRTVPESEATGLVADLYAEDLADLGYVPSHSQVMAINPEAVRAFQALAATIAKPLGMRNYELVTLAAAEAIGSDACRLAHSRKSLKYMDAEEVVAVVTDYRSAGLSPAEVAMMDFAARLSADSSTMTDADAEALREHGFSDREIVDIALAAGLRNFYSRALHALAVDVDVPPGVPAGVLAALGR